MKRSRLRPKPRDRGTDLEAARAWFVAVTRGKKCVSCRRPHSQMQAHHVVEQQALRAAFPYGVLLGGVAEAVGRDDDLEGLREAFGVRNVRTLQELLWDLRNGVPVCPDCHERHTNHSRKLELAKIPAAAVKFAVELGLQHRLGGRYYAQ